MGLEHCVYLSNKWEIMGNRLNRQGLPPASTRSDDGGSLARRAWHTARQGKAFRGDPVILSQSVVMSAIRVWRLVDVVLVLRMMTT